MLAFRGIEALLIDKSGFREVCHYTITQNACPHFFLQFDRSFGRLAGIKVHEFSIRRFPYSRPVKCTSCNSKKKLFNLQETFWWISWCFAKARTHYFDWKIWGLLRFLSRNWGNLSWVSGQWCIVRFTRPCCRRRPACDTALDSAKFSAEFYSLFSGTQYLSSKFVLPGVIFFCQYSVFCRHEGGPASSLNSPSWLLSGYNRSWHCWVSRRTYSNM